VRDCVGVSVSVCVGVCVCVSVRRQARNVGEPSRIGRKCIADQISDLQIGSRERNMRDTCLHSLISVFLLFSP